MEKPDQTQEKRTEKLQIALPPTQKEKWLASADRRRWTLTTLVTEAVEWYILLDKR